MFDTKLAQLYQRLQGGNMVALMQAISEGVSDLVSEWQQHKLPLLEVGLCLCACVCAFVHVHVQFVPGIERKQLKSRAHTHTNTLLLLTGQGIQHLARSTHSCEGRHPRSHCSSSRTGTGW